MTRAEILEKLEALGDDPAAKLSELGIRGKRRNPFSCPLARYLLREGATRPSVGVDLKRSGTTVGEVGAMYVILPKESPVARFRLDFDNGKYPDLEAP